MAQLRLKGVPVGSDLGTVSASNGIMTDSTVVQQFLKPSPVTGLPRISDGYDTDTLTVDTNGLTGITAYEWRIVGGAVQGTGSTLSGAGLGGQWIECAVTCDQGTPVSPPMMVYMSMHMGMAMPASHIEDERSILSIIPHASATHIAVQDGNWTDPGTWLGGEMPRNGAIVLIPRGRTVTYDQSACFRLDHLRNEGTLTWARDRDTEMIVDTLLNARGGRLLIGESNATRLPASYTAEIIIAGRDYSLGAYTPTNMRLTRDERLWGRGLLNLGTRRMWGAEKLAWGRAEPIDAGTTSLTMRSAPTGWAIGDRVLIGGTETVWTQGQPLALQTEERVISGISGNTVSWDQPLTYPHKNMLAGSTRTDLYPIVCLKESNNIKIRSEAPDLPHQRGHTADMHHMAVVDIWNVDHIGLGRTSKRKDDPAGVIPETGQVKLFIEDTYSPTLKETGSATIDLTGFQPQEGEDYWIKIAPVDADSGSFVAADYRVQRSSTLDYRAQSGDTDSDLAAGLAAAYASYVSSRGLDTNVLNITASGGVLSLTSGVTNATDTIQVQLGVKSYYKAAADDDNLQSRYPIHLHKMGFNPPVPPIVSDCYVGGSPGWAIVHHDCEADFFNNVMYQFAGSGMVSESGNELGAWVGNVALDTTYQDSDALTSGVKVRETERGMAGDPGRFGYGFLMRGRAMRVNNNIACGCTWGYVFHHRQSGGSESARLTSLKGPLRVDADLGGIGIPVHYSNNGVPRSTVAWWHYPIVHFADNESIACRDGFFVTKNLPDQEHDAGVKLKRFKAWACLNNGWEGEYVANYILEGFDCVNGNGSADGIGFGANMFQMFVRNGRIEGFRNSVSFIGTEPNNEGATVNYSTTNPRFAVFGVDMVDPTGSDVASSDMPDGISFASIYRREDDWAGTAIDYDQDPDWTFPLEGGTWNGFNSGTMLTSLSNSDGKKIDNISASARLAPHKELIKDQIMPTLNTQLRWHKRRTGWYSYNGSETLVIPFLISDRVTARPAIKTLMFRNTGGPLNAEGGPGLLGPFIYSTTPVTRPDIVTTVAAGGTVSLDMLAGASGGGGAGTYVLHRLHHIKPDHGRISIDYATGQVIYRPDRGYVGPDEWYMFVESQGQYATVRVDVLVGPGGAVTSPVVETHFSVTGGAEQISVELFDQPSCGHRRVVRTQYSTDGGATWRRLTNFWVKAVHTIFTASDGSALVPGTYSLRIRYQTDYDYATSPVSAATSVVVTAV